METLGEYLKRIREKERKIGLRELSRRAGISHSYLSQIENGNKYPKSYILRALAEELDIDYNILMYKAGYIDKENYKQDYVKEESGYIRPNALEKYKKSLDLSKFLTDDETKIIFNDITLSKTENDFLYQVLDLITASNKPVDENKLNKLLEIIKLMLR